MAAVLSAIVIGSTITGVLAGEWKSAGWRPIGVMIAGVLCLVVAMGVLAKASF